MFPSSVTISLTTSFFGRGEAPVLRIHCFENAVALQDCYVDSLRFHRRYRYSIFVNYNFDVHGIICQGNTTSETECVPGDVKLVGGLKANEGRIEVCIDGFWGTVCEEGWDDEDAIIVLCHQLGLFPTGT